jgi:hypothetical protein
MENKSKTKIIMKKLLIILFGFLCITVGVKSQVNMTVNGLDQGTVTLIQNDYWTISYVLKQYNDAHTQVIAVWQGSNLNPAVCSLTYNGSNNPFSKNCSFTTSPSIPDISNANFRVLVGVKRYSINLGDYVCGFEKYSGWMNTAGLASGFAVSGVLVDP